MKVVIYTHYLKGGGAEKRAATYANYLFNSGVDVHVVTMHPVEQEYELNSNIARHFVAQSKDEYFKLSPGKRMKGLRSLLADVRPDIVVSFLTTYGLYACLAKRHCEELKDTKLIYAVSLYQRKYSLKSRFIDFLCCLLSDRISLQCHEQLKCNRLFKKKCIVNYNPIHDRWDYYKREYSSLSIVSVGRLTKQKHFDLTIKAVHDAHITNPKISLDIYGSGPLKVKLQKLIKKLDAESYIKINEFSFNLPEVLKEHNVMISSSRYEGFPNGLAEGMLSGLVCLSTPCPTGPKEMIENCKNGMLFNGRRELVECIIKLGSNPELCEAISVNSRNTVLEKFEASVVLPKFLNDISNTI